MYALWFIHKMSRTEYLPIEQAVIVPSTAKADKPISKAEMRKRVDNVRRFLSTKFGGYTSTKGMGGWYSDDKKKLIKEKIVKVTGFSTKKDYNKNKTILTKQIRTWGKKWGQETMGYEKEGDLFIYNTQQKKKAKLKAKIKRRKKK